MFVLEIKLSSLVYLQARMVSEKIEGLIYVEKTSYVKKIIHLCFKIKIVLMYAYVFYVMF